MAKFQRDYILTVQTVNEKIDEFVTIKMPLTIEFDLIRNPLSASNIGHITVYNLGEKTRNLIYKDQLDTEIYRSCELRAGYEGDNTLPIIMKGNVVHCYSYRRGTDFLTVISVVDGAFSIMNGYSNLAIAKGQRKKDLIETLMKDLPNINKRIVGDYDGVIPRGNSIIGNSAELLEELTSGGFFIYDETAIALKDNEVLSGLINVINANTGLLGTPKREKSKLTISIIFEPRIRMAQTIELESFQGLFNGQYKVVAIHHKGTISASVCGSVITNLELWYGTKNLELVSG